MIHNELVSLLGASAPSLRTVYRWAKRFQDSGDDTEDMSRSGRPITGCSVANIQKALIDEDRRISFNDIEALTSLCRGTIVNIIHIYLNKRKLSSRWIPHLLTAEQKLKRVTFCTQNLKMFEEGKWRLCDVVTGDESWIYYGKIKKKALNLTWAGPGDSPGTVVKRNQFEPKRMISVFFKSVGALFVDVLERGKSIDNKYYLNKCFKPLIESLESERPVSGIKNIKLLHDNARP